MPTLLMEKKLKFRWGETGLGAWGSWAAYCWNYWN